MKFYKAINIYLIYLTVFALILGNAALSLAHGSVNIQKLSISNETNINSSNLNSPENILREIVEDGPSEEEKQIMAEQDEFLQRIENELNFSKADYRQILNNISDTKTKLKEITDEKLSLSEQIINLNNLINVTTESLFSVKGEFANRAIVRGAK